MQDKISMIKKENLFKIALEEFIDKGYNNASLNNILKRAEISKGSFYYHFNNKKQLYLYLFRNLHNIEHEYIDKWKLQNNINYEELNFFEILKLEGNIGIEICTKYPKYYKFWRSMYEEKNPEVREIIDEEMQKLIKEGHAKDYFGPLIEEGFRKKDFRQDLSKEFINRLLNDSMINFFNCFVKNDEDLGIEKITQNYENYVDFLERGLGENNKGGGNK